MRRWLIIAAIIIGGCQPAPRNATFVPDAKSQAAVWSAYYAMTPTPKETAKPTAKPVAPKPKVPLNTFGLPVETPKK